MSREWARTLGDPAVLSDLRAAAADCMAMVCNHEPSECDCPENRMTMMEFVDWIELEAKREQGRPVRFEKGYRPYPKRDEREWNLAASG